mmetsp:Transcript_3907/g.5047  ORF Transcript_3907/g.5047 Transcript_3907/m.5047 type:complete len:93 (-) Transcript_3907:88-366(-)|eukprot:CAMPEP_0172482080 /NCGR_PEP_ID=MMETSP1066-20121228/8355_1 /TAXON_ID=671091 /ORGANISM="Coscinodiscus wailesii, Strain CCMP2513" /LENGTH=92 /DNA_ID=CAMNT_0013244953 /DNA_START=135 /DNA_END=413 /DNA_ORIENTATION=-
MASKQAVQAVIRNIFGTVPGASSRQDLRLLRKPLKGVIIARYHPKPLEPSIRRVDPTYLTEQEARRKDKLRRLRMRGKGPPKKGEGKRTKKK